MRIRDWSSDVFSSELLWLGDSDLGARDLGGIAGQEVIHGLIGRQPGDRRQYAERIGGQHDDVAWLRPPIVGARIGDAIDRISPARILGEAGMVEIEC